MKGALLLRQGIRFYACLVGLGFLLSHGTSQVGEQLVYTGEPVIRATGTPDEVRREKLAGAEASRYTVRIVRRGSRYLWASREDRQLTPSFAGRYVTFTSDVGFIRIVDPIFDDARRPLKQSDPNEAFDYLEVMYLHLGVVIYWGTGSGVAVGR